MHGIMNTTTTRTTAFANEEATMQDRRTRECMGMTFPFKLYEMLQDAEKDGETCIVSWRHHGNSFTIHEPAIFCENIMPYYFDQGKYKSFQRQLNLYGFVWLRGEGKGKHTLLWSVNHQRHTQGCLRTQEHTY